MDSWDDDEFEVPTAFVPTVAPVSWEDEEEEEAPAPRSAPSPPKPEAPLKPKQLKKLKMKELEEKRKADHIVASQRAQELAFIQQNETPAERKAREQKAIEDADYNLTLDAFGIEAAAAPASEQPRPVTITVENAEEALSKMSLFALQDYEKLADLIVQRLENSNRIYQMEFMKILLKKGSSNLTADDMKELATVIAMVKNDKIAAAKPKTKKKKQQPAGKQGYTKVQRGVGADFNDDDYYDDYADYDDFM